ncbi:hypothetical protein [Bilophila wadsworthia]|uniref:hypothetical protein n=1 Tax=Bilophila wadsworthia TaxID=35833 RepID=UPI00242FABF7|nr:hypothetical protein [Bilophila wadsworthia]
MNGRMIGVIGGTGRVGRECLRYLHENTAFGLLIGGGSRRGSASRFLPVRGCL